MDETENSTCTHSYVKLNVFHIPDIFLVNTLLLYSLSPYSKTERQTESQIHLLRVGWRNLFFQLCGCVRFLFWQEIVFGVMYVLSVQQYNCAVVSVFCCGKKANLVQVFSLNPRIFFLYIGIGIQRGSWKHQLCQ